MVNFVDTTLNTSATGGVVKYTLTHADSSTELVQIDLATPIQTQGTALNKVTFDSIQTDLTNLSNNKLNVSNKATQSEAETGTNDTKYMTPLKVQQKINSLKTSASGTTTGSVSLTGYTNQVVEICGYCRYAGTSNAYSRLTGTQITYYGTHTSANTYQTTCPFNTYTASSSYPAFRIVIDFNTKTFTINSTCYTNSASVYMDTTCGTFSTLTSINFGNSTWAVTMLASN